MSEDTAEALRRLLHEKIAFELRAGVLSEDILGEQLAVILEEELGAAGEALWHELLPRVRDGMLEQLARERAWTERTANDELEAALQSVADRGIMGLEANGTTLQHGWAIAEAVAAEDDPEARGAVFYHLQDLERAVAGEGLTLAFGAFDPAALAAVASRTPPPEGATETLVIQRRTQNVEASRDEQRERTRVIGEEIVAVLRQHGFAPVWDGSPRTRIVLPSFAWQRRRQTVAPAAGPRPELHLPSSAPATPEPVCPDCEGKGWLPPLVPGDFSDFCWCKGGKRPRPVQPAPVSPIDAVAPPAKAAPPAPPFEAAPPAPPAKAAPPVPSAAAAAPAPAEGVLARLKKWLGSKD